MSDDFPEQDRRGLADWLDDCDVPEQPDVPRQRGGPAYVVSFGWIPARLPPRLVPPLPVSPPLIPSPRRAPDDVA